MELVCKPAAEVLGGKGKKDGEPCGEYRCEYGRLHLEEDVVMEENRHGSRSGQEKRVGL